jgi:hypothetical protein
MATTNGRDWIFTHAFSQSSFKTYGKNGLARWDTKDVRSFKSRMSFIVEEFGERIADEIKPSEIDTWLGAHDWAPATKNRYKSVP